MCTDGAQTVTRKSPTRRSKFGRPPAAALACAAQVLVEVDHQGPRERRVESRPVSSPDRGGREPGNQPTWGESPPRMAARSRARVARKRGRAMSCPNPSAHPVGVRQPRRPPARAERSEATQRRHLWLSSSPLVVGFVPVARRRRPSPPSTTSRPASTRLYHQAEQASERLQRRQGRARPSSASDLVSLQADQDRQDDRLDQRPRAGPGLHRQPVRRHRASPPSARSSSPTTRVRSSPSCRRCRRTTTSSRSCSTDYTTEAQGARHPPARRPTTARGRDGRDSRSSSPPRRRRSTTSSPRPRTCSASSRTRSARRCSPRAAATSGCRPASPASGRAAAAVQLRPGPGRRRLRLRRRRPERLRLLRA